MTSVGSTAVAEPAEITDAVVEATFPHDQTAFTQGLIVSDGVFIESTGMLGESTVRRVEIASGEVIDSTPLSGAQFGEGLAESGDLLVQLTWRSEVANVYSSDTLDLVATVTYDGEGWGLASTADGLVMSNGSSTLSFREPTTFAVTSTVEVTDGGVPVDKLNELEMVGGELWANVWTSSRIARIDPLTGQVLGWIELAALRPESTLSDPDAVANGIAYDANSKRVFVTGKRWDVMYQIALPADLDPS